jgi:hypothetical protein
LAKDPKALALFRSQQEDIEELAKLTNQAIAELKQDQEEKPYKLSYLDPYVIAAVSDLLALTLGQNEKAVFLEEVKDKYPTEMKFIQPGLINLYYYMTDAKVKAGTSWPREEEIAELDHAMNATDYIIEQTRARKQQRSMQVGPPQESLDPTA